MRKIVVAAMASLMLVGCGASPEEKVLEDLRQSVPAIAHNDDATLLDLLDKACDVMRQDGIMGMFTVGRNYDLDMDEVGRVSGIATKFYCPEVMEGLTP